ncbi:MAG TPA: hypothetical protein VH109_03910 [Steroidobacteraceae bacterium]|jgi:hypothetical protein|nr:hypothetical protein [Steroidobacteraceae bacterium]
MAHTFLFEPAVWTGTGTLWRADGQALEAQARTEIAHRPECWLLSGKLRVLGSPPTEFVQAHLIEPPGKVPGEGLKWTFETAMFGKLQGRYAAIGDSILSVYGCEQSGYYGAEHMAQLDAANYRSSGMLLLKDRLVYSWQMLLTRAP